VKSIRRDHVIVAFIGIVLGCAGASLSPVRTPRAQPAAGKWQCYDPEHFDSGVGAAASTPIVERMSKGLNVVAFNAPAGTVITPGFSARLSADEVIFRDVVCVKY
jgi:hypothetical protein